jgi:hypothetical protein
MSNVSTLTNVQLATECGNAIGEMQGALLTAEAKREAGNVSILALHKAKVVVGTYKKDGTGCAIATAFVDGGIAKGLKQSTMQKTYLPTFKAHVASGKPVTDWNSQRPKQKANGAKKDAKTTKEFSAKLATCFRDAEFEGFINDLQASFHNDEIKTLLEGVKSYLESEGVDLKAKA